MKIIELHLPDQTAMALQEAADKLSLSAEDLLKISIEEKLAQLNSHDDFQSAAEYVLNKNSELYKRLA
jgi:antitoxin FitA